MKLYFLEKLSDINYRISINEGNASRRLASEAIKIHVQLPVLPNEVPNLYRKEFSKLRKIVGDTIQNLSSPGLTPTRIRGMHNKDAVKYIKLLINIEDRLSND